MATKYLSKDKEKICNICGEFVLVYTVIDNAPLCEKYVPTKQVKKIPNADTMLSKLMDKKI
jgi:hypothetical protein